MLKKEVEKILTYHVESGIILLITYVPLKTVQRGWQGKTIRKVG